MEGSTEAQRPEAHAGEASRRRVVWPEGRPQGEVGTRGHGTRATTSGDALEIERPQYGPQPAYFAERGGEVIVSASLAAVAKEIGPRRPHRARLAALLADRAYGTKATAHVGIERVRPGESIRLRVGHAPERRWLPLLDATPDTTLDVTRAASEVRARFVRAVEKAMEGARRVAVLVSGGLDSSAILAVALDVGRRTGTFVDPITLSFASKGDDRPYQQVLERTLGVALHRMTPAEGAPFVRASLVHDGSPHTWGTAAWELAMTLRARQRGADAILIGANGDDVFLGDTRALVERWDNGARVAALRAAMRLETYWETRAAERALRFVLEPLARRRVPDSLRPLWRRLRGRRIAPPWVTRESLDLVDAAERDTPDTRQPAQNCIPELATSNLLMEQLDQLAAVEAEFDVPFRRPFLDRSLLEFVARVPRMMMLHGHRQRGLFREAMRGILPEEIRQRRTKASFEIACVEMLDAMGGIEALADLATVERLAEERLVDARAFGRAFRQMVKERERADWVRLWVPLALEAFLRSGGSR
jgi:asparagine synthase (glutamine-hydrolysing)